MTGALHRELIRLDSGGFFFYIYLFVYLEFSTRLISLPLLRLLTPHPSRSGVHPAHRQDWGFQFLESKASISCRRRGRAQVRAGRRCAPRRPLL